MRGNIGTQLPLCLPFSPLDVALPKTGDHSRPINDAAKRALRPLGFQQKGRSRLWFADRGFWVVMVEFQPSGFGNGSYLNLGLSWLWHPRAWSYGHMYRAGRFTRFSDPETVLPQAEHLAETASAEAHKLDTAFPSLKQIAAHLKREANDLSKRQNPWTLYHAAIGAGLTGDVEFGAICFDGLIAQKADIDWVKEIQTEGRKLKKVLLPATAFRVAIRKKVERTRSEMKLPPLPDS